MPESPRFCFQAKRLVRFQRLTVEDGVVVERHGVEAQVCPLAAFLLAALPLAALDVVDRRGAERQRRLSAILRRAAGQPDIRRIVRRTAGVMWLLSKSRSSIVRISLVLADISMISTSPWATMSRMILRYSSSMRNRASPA